MRGFVLTGSSRVASLICPADPYRRHLVGCVQRVQETRNAEATELATERPHLGYVPMCCGRTSRRSDATQSLVINRTLA